MSWNNYIERQCFKEREMELGQICRESGMSQEKIKRLYEADLKDLNNDEVFYKRNVSLDSLGDRDVGEVNLSEVLVMLGADIELKPYIDYEKAYWWLEEIQNEQIYEAVLNLSERQKRLIDLIVFRGYTRIEVAEMLNIRPQTVGEQFDRIKQILAKKLVKLI